MDIISGEGPVLVVAPHPDDEVLGVGGTIARLVDAGRDVHVVVVTRGSQEDFASEFVETVRAEAVKAHTHLGVKETHWLDLPASRLSELPHRDLNKALGTVFRQVAPELVFIPHVGDIHLDHQHVFLSALVASRPYEQAYPTTILCYETLSETNWNAPYLTPSFVPNVFVDITSSLARKLEAFALFESQVYQPPHERAVETLRALSTLRGATVHREACEAFVLVRHSA